MNKKRTLPLLQIILVSLIFSSSNTNLTESYSENSFQLDTHQIMEAATDFTIQDVSTGVTYSLNDLIGRVVVLDLFATWCPPCAVALPYLRELYLKYSEDEVRIISIDVDSSESQSLVSQFRHDNNMDWIVGRDTDGSISAVYGSGSIPTFHIIDQKGNIHWSDSGFTVEETWPIMSSKIAALVENSESPTQNLSPTARVLVTILEVVGGLGAAVAIVYGIYKLRARMMRKKCLSCKNIANTKCSRCGSYICSDCSSKGCPNCGSRKFIRL
jgi:thiol-disulfide isomerase/thioredoxin